MTDKTNGNKESQKHSNASAGSYVPPKDTDASDPNSDSPDSSGIADKDSVAQSSNVSDNNENDLSEGRVSRSLASGISQPNKIIDFKILEARVFLFGKGLAFLSALLLAICFLSHGLSSASDAVSHILKAHNVELSSEQSTKERQEHSAIANKSQELEGTDSDISKGSNSEVKIEEGGTFASESMLYSGTVVTIIIALLAVGLTLILTILKFTFVHDKSNNNDDDSVEIAGPMSELIKVAAQYVKKKLGN